MKNTIRFASSSLFILLLFFGQESFAIDTFCCVIGIRDGGGYSGTGSNLNDVGQSPTDHQGTADSETYRQAKKTEALKAAYDKCVSDTADVKLLECSKKAVTDLNSFQQVCSMAGGASATVGLAGGYLVKSGPNWVFKTVGGVLIAGGTVLGSGATMCFNTATNQKTLDDLTCQDNYKKDKQTCRNQTGYQGS